MKRTLTNIVTLATLALGGCLTLPPEPDQAFYGHTQPQTLPAPYSAQDDVARTLVRLTQIRTGDARWEAVGNVLVPLLREGSAPFVTLDDLKVSCKDADSNHDKIITSEEARQLAVQLLQETGAEITTPTSGTNFPIPQGYKVSEQIAAYMAQCVAVRNHWADPIIDGHGIAHIRAGTVSGLGVDIKGLQKGYKEADCDKDKVITADEANAFYNETLTQRGYFAEIPRAEGYVVQDEETAEVLMLLAGIRSGTGRFVFTTEKGPRGMWVIDRNSVHRANVKEDILQETYKAIDTEETKAISKQQAYQAYLAFLLNDEELLQDNTPWSNKICPGVPGYEASTKTRLTLLIAAAIEAKWFDMRNGHFENGFRPYQFFDKCRDIFEGVYKGAADENKTISYEAAETYLLKKVEEEREHDRKKKK